MVVVEAVAETRLGSFAAQLIGVGLVRSMRVVLELLFVVVVVEIADP